nr:MAG TPA: protein of unknown function (DUF5445) [Caudoviricetes sp.]
MLFWKELSIHITQSFHCLRQCYVEHEKHNRSDIRR